jgi:hypothetical protein
MHLHLELDYLLRFRLIRFIKAFRLCELFSQGIDHTGAFWKSSGLEGIRKSD